MNADDNAMDDFDAPDAVSEAAEELYLSVIPKQDRAAARLRKAVNPAMRARLLDELAGYDEFQAGLHAETYGPDPIPQEDGRDMSESLAYSAAIFRAVAAAERAQATGQPRSPAAEPVETAARHTLNRIASTPGNAIARRARLFDELYDALEPVVGGQAAEVVATSMSEAYVREVEQGS